MATNEPDRAPSWRERLEATDGEAPDIVPAEPAAPVARSRKSEDLSAQLEEAGITRLREEATSAARRDAQAGVPDADAGTGHEHRWFGHSAPPRFAATLRPDPAVFARKAQDAPGGGPQLRWPSGSSS